MSESIFKEMERAFGEVERTVTSAVSVTDGMMALLDYCERVSPAEVWAGLRSVDYQVDVEGIYAWLTDLLKTEPVPANVKAFWFGLTEVADDDDNHSYVVYISGSTNKYTKKSMDWACWREDSYLPGDRYAPSPALHAIYAALQGSPDQIAFGEYVLLLGYAGLAVTEAVRRLPAGALFGELEAAKALAKTKRDVVIGFDDGDFVHLGVATPTAWAASTP